MRIRRLVPGVLAALLAARFAAAGGSRSSAAAADAPMMGIPALPVVSAPQAQFPSGTSAGEALPALSPDLEAAAPQAAAKPAKAVEPARVSLRPSSRPVEALKRLIGLGEPDAVEQVTRALEGVPAVRVYFAKAPGYGHQSATLAVARRLRELGYRGRIEGVYAPTVDAKLGVLIPEFDPKGPDVQTIPVLGMTLESLDHVKARAASEPVALALTGGNDMYHASVSNLAEELGAERFLNLQPLGWRIARHALYARGADKELTTFPDGATLPFIHRPTRAEELDDSYFDALRRQPSLSPAKADGLRALTRRLAEHDVLPAYGLAFFQPPNLHRLLLGVSKAMDKRPDLFSRRGVVVPLLLDSSHLTAGLKEAGDLKTSAWFSKMKRRRLDEIAAQDGRLRERLVFANIDDPDLAEKLDRLPAGAILVLETGTVPPAVFESLFAASTLPPTLEGKNAGTLARLLGIPFVSVNERTLDDVLDVGAGPVARHFRLGMRQLDARLYGARRAAAASRALGETAFYERSVTRHDFETLASYFIEAKTPGSRLRRWFAARRLGPEESRRDKLIRALRVALPKAGK